MCVTRLMRETWHSSTRAQHDYITPAAHTREVTNMITLPLLRTRAGYLFACDAMAARTYVYSS